MLKAENAVFLPLLKERKHLELIIKEELTDEN